MIVMISQEVPGKKADDPVQWESRGAWDITIPAQFQAFLGEFSKHVLAGNKVRAMQVIGETPGGGNGN